MFKSELVSIVGTVVDSLFLYRMMPDKSLAQMHQMLRETLDELLHKCAVSFCSSLSYHKSLFPCICLCWKCFPFFIQHHHHLEAMIEFRKHSTKLRHLPNGACS